MDKPRLKRDWIERYVRLKREVRTHGGVVFAAGDVMRVAGNRSGLRLVATNACPDCQRQFRVYVTGVNEDAVELLPPDYAPMPPLYPRPLVAEFARDIERELRAHDDRPGIENEPVEYLWERLQEELRELRDALDEEDGSVASEAADCGAFLAAIATQYRRKPAKVGGY